MQLVQRIALAVMKITSMQNMPVPLEIGVKHAFYWQVLTIVTQAHTVDCQA